MTRDELLDLFRRSGALLEGHFRLSSGLHSAGYLQCALVLQHPQRAEALGRAIADTVARVCGRHVVLSPALGGVVIGHEVGRALGVRADLRRASGRRADAAPRVRARRNRSRPRRRGRAHHRRLDARDDAGGDSGRRPRRSAPRRSSIAAAATASFDVPFASLLDVDLADPRAGPLSVVRAGAAGHQTRIAAYVVQIDEIQNSGILNLKFKSYFDDLEMPTLQDHRRLRRHRLRRAGSGRRPA